LPPAESRPSSQSLATRAVRGVFWTGSPFVLQIVTTILFFRWLPKGDMGHFEAALVLVMLLALAADLGLGSALVQFREAEPRHFDVAFWTCLSAGLGVTLLVWVGAPWLAGFVPGENPQRFVQVLQVLVWLVPFAAVSGIFRARLQRELEFRGMSLAEIGSVVAHTLLSVWLLWQGYSIMAPAISAVVREVVLLVGMAVAAGWRPGFSYDTKALRRIGLFGLNLTGSRGLNYVNSNLASLMIYPALGTEAMEYFRFAYRLTLMPLVRISTVITRVFFPTFSAMQQDDDMLRRAYQRAVQGVALALWPLLAGVAVMADEVVALAGQDMAPAAWPLRLLALATLIKAVGTAVGSVFLAKGRASWALWWSLFSIVVLLPSLLWAVGRGVVEVCAVIAATGAIFLWLSQALTNRLIALRMATYLRGLIRPGLITLVAGGGLWLLRPMLPANPWTSLLLAAGAGALLLLLGMRLFAWSACCALWRSARGRSSGAAPAGEPV
jgi:O-antigen/teichoic acid export membrane protein